jgi:hypothetical protein
MTMKRALFLALPAVWLLGGYAQIKAADDPPKDKKETCEPQPSCRLDYVTIIPGAPGTGLKPQGDVTEKGGGIIVNGISPNDVRGTYRLPSIDFK